MKWFSWSSKKSFGWLVGVLIALAVTSVAVFYHVAIFEVDGKSYIASMSKAAKDLNESCRRVADTSERLLLTEPSLALGDGAAGMQKITNEVRLLRVELEEFRQISDTLPSHPYAFTSASYSKSLSLKEQSKAAIDQVNEVLDEYEGLLAFLTSYYTIRQQLSDELLSFNALADLDALAGQGPTYELVADSLDIKTTELSRLTPPRGFEEITQRTIALHRAVADGFRDLASGLSPPIDAAIYSAATQLEGLTSRNDQLSGSELDSVLENSPIIKSVSDLRETTDRFRF